MFSRIGKRWKLAAHVLALVAALLSGGCTSFNHEWKNAATQPVSNGMEGRWEGFWLSDANHHTGSLRCIVTKQENGVFRARFRATYGRALKFGYTVPLHVEETTNGFRFNGEANLGWLAGGMYHYEGHAGTTNFFSTYSCKYDHGTFQMHRP